jgi:hypothetical protein
MLMLKEILRRLLGSKKHSKNGGYDRSSDSYYKPRHGQPPKHNQYGSGYYKKKGSSRFSSS